MGLDWDARSYPAVGDATPNPLAVCIKMLPRPVAGRPVASGAKSDWSPDATKLAGSAGWYPEREIGARVGYPQWSADGKTLHFHVRSPGSLIIYQLVPGRVSARAFCGGYPN
jgi:hypothetical protein